MAGLAKVSALRITDWPDMPTALRTLKRDVTLTPTGNADATRAKAARATAIGAKAARAKDAKATRATAAMATATKATAAMAAKGGDQPRRCMIEWAL